MGMCASTRVIEGKPREPPTEVLQGCAVGPLSVILVECKKLISPCSAYVYSATLEQPLVVFQCGVAGGDDALKVRPPFSRDLVRLDTSDPWLDTFVVDAMASVHRDLTLIVHVEGRTEAGTLGRALAAIGESLHGRAHNFVEVTLLWPDAGGRVQRYTILRT
jgi:hypothetical protein